MIELGYCQSPSIVVLSSDGTRFELPESAAAHSLLIRAALDRWSTEHAPPSEDDEASTASLDANTATTDELTPDHIDDPASASSCYTRSNVTQQIDGYDDRGLGGTPSAAVRTMVSVSNNAVEPVSFAASSSSSTPSDEVLRGEIPIEEGDADTSTVQRKSPDAAAPSASNNNNKERAAASVSSGSKTPSDIDVGEEEGRDAALPDAPAAAGGDAAAAGGHHHHVDPAALDDGSEMRSSTAALPSAAERSSAEDQSLSTPVVVVVAPEADDKDDDESNENGTYHELEPQQLLQQHHSDGSGRSPGIDSSEWVSPTSVHQRTPVMLGGDEDDDVVIVSGDGREETLKGFARSSPANISPTNNSNNNNNTNTNNSNAHYNNNNSGSNSNSIGRPQQLASHCGCDDNGKGGAAAAASYGDGLVGDVLDSARISLTEVLIDLRGSVDEGSPNASMTTVAQQSSSSEFVEKQSGSPKNATATTVVSVGSSRALQAPAPIVQVCVNYLLHFCVCTPAPSPTVYGRSSNNLRHDVPAVLPAPLTAPLFTLLSPWELHYLYVVILGYDVSMLETVKSAAKLNLNYRFPASSLSDEKARHVLVMPAPGREGLQRLRDVILAAKGLGIDSLRDLCNAWMADFMIRASYGAADFFEAAHIIRQCFRIQADWTRKETDNLKIENEWPANEEDY